MKASQIATLTSRARAAAWNAGAIADVVNSRAACRALNDYGDCEKIGLVQDWCVRVSKETHRSWP
ncbi:MAG TPA: hypothetical protein VG796_04240 [Verrucomicrobiales bacterium]|nr:hypothetical protein [Verrucomicrobiales bacterium]